MPVFHSSNMRQQFRCRCCVFRILHIPEEFKRLYHLISLALFVFFLGVCSRALSLYFDIRFLQFLCSLGHARSHWQCVSKISEAFLLARRKVFDVCIAMASIYRFKKGLWIVFFRLRSIGMRVFFTRARVLQNLRFVIWLACTSYSVLWLFPKQDSQLNNLYQMI